MRSLLVCLVVLSLSGCADAVMNIATGTLGAALALPPISEWGK